ncbi:MAG: ACT domain-containing protein [Clostridiales bacterium]|nr:ACT domain-containing protein [Clostridiales bacterium]
MSVKQINVFLENEPGRLAEMTKVLSEAKIDIRAIYVTDSTSYGIIRMIVNQPDDAKLELQTKGFTVSVSHVIAVELKDVPGTLDKVLGLLSGNNIQLEYLYAFVGRASNDAVVVLRVDDRPKTLEIFEQNGVRVLDDKEVYGI